MMSAYGRRPGEEPARPPGRPGNPRWLRPRVLNCLVTLALLFAASHAASAQAQDLFAPRYTVGTSSYPMDTAIGDVTGDGVPDMLVTSDIGNFFQIFRGLGSGSFTSIGTASTAQRPESIALGDLNGDSVLDVVTTGDVGPDTISVRLGSGNGSFGGLSQFSVGTDPKDVTLADMDNDGNLDAVVSTGGADSVSVLFGQGNGSFAGRVDYPGSGSVGLGDLNGDGWKDLVVGGSDIGVRLGTGDGVLGARVVYSGGG
ncbi:MAG: VCBS repeat-containing protein, partial [bacterium]